jgi:phenylacetate-coenzyme A ligase PaaK-like adenylate-forming protein
MLEVELLERDRWSRDDLLAYQGERVRNLVRHAVAQSPFTWKRSALMQQTGRFQSCPPCRRRR